MQAANIQYDIKWQHNRRPREWRLAAKMESKHKCELSDLYFTNDLIQHK